MAYHLWKFKSDIAEDEVLSLSDDPAVVILQIYDYIKSEYGEFENDDGEIEKVDFDEIPISLTHLEHMGSFDVIGYG